MLDDGLNMDGDEKAEKLEANENSGVNYYNVLNAAVKARESDLLNQRNNMATKS